MNLSRLGKNISPEHSLKTNLGDLIGTINQMVDKVRKISLDLRPGMLDDIGLVATLEWYCEDFGKHSGIDTSFETDIIHEKIGQEITVNLFRDNKTLGIRFMMERALMLNGHYRINSIPGNGTLVEVELPFAPFD
jgi:signal transduction histidine kinase